MPITTDILPPLRRKNMKFRFCGKQLTAMQILGRLPLKCIRSKQFRHWPIPAVELPFIPNFDLARFNLDQPRQSGNTPVLTAAQERYAFLNYNYARCQLVDFRKRISFARKDLKLIEPACVEMERWESYIVNANMPLILWRNFVARFVHHGVTIDDLVEEGQFALISATRAFDCERGFKFSTYACTSIIKRMHRCHEDSTKRSARYPQMSERASQWMGERDAVAPLENREQIDILKKVLDRNLAGLNENQMFVIRKRHLVRHHERPTLEVLGQKLGLTRERIRQIEAQALDKLREAFVDMTEG